jgi:hypothetical protein
MLNAWVRPERAVYKCMQNSVHELCMSHVSLPGLTVDRLEQASCPGTWLQTIPTRAMPTMLSHTDYAGAANALSMRVSRLIHIFTDYNIQSTTISQGRQ